MWVKIDVVTTSPTAVVWDSGLKQVGIVAETPTPDPELNKITTTKISDVKVTITV